MVSFLLFAQSSMRNDDDDNTKNCLSYDILVSSHDWHNDINFIGESPSNGTLELIA